MRNFVEESGSISVTGREALQSLSTHTPLINFNMAHPSPRIPSMEYTIQTPCHLKLCTYFGPPSRKRQALDIINSLNKAIISGATLGTKASCSV
jgi:hypothetical protein